MSVFLNQNLRLTTPNFINKVRESLTSCGGPQTRHVLSVEGNASFSSSSLMRPLRPCQPELSSRVTVKNETMRPAASSAASSGRKANSSTDRAL